MSIGNERITLTVREAAEIAGLGKNTMYEAIKRGDFPFYRVGKRILIARSAFFKILNGDRAL